MEGININNLEKFKLVCKKCGNEDTSLSFKKDVIHYTDGVFESDYNGVLVEVNCSCCCSKESFKDWLYANKNIN